MNTEAIHIRIEFVSALNQVNNTVRRGLDLTISMPEAASKAIERIVALFYRFSLQLPAECNTAPVAESTSTPIRPVLSFNARKLLATLQDLAKEAAEYKCDKHSWRSRSDWFTLSKMDRRRKDAMQLISELHQAGAIDCDKNGKWTLYRAKESI